MLNHYILSYLGEDRPGLVDELSAIIADHGGSWLEGRMANLAGKFTGVVHLSVEASAGPELESALESLNREDLVISLTRVEPDEIGDRESLVLKVIGADRPGIVREIATLFNRLGVNVEDLQTDVTPGAWSGEPVFQAYVEISMVGPLNTEELLAELENLSDDLMVEVLEDD